MRSCSDIFKKFSVKTVPILIFFLSLSVKLMLYSFAALSYDETAYSITARNIALNGGWLNLYNSTDLFFFPPLFNWISAVLVLAGFEQIAAVRTVSILLSSGIPVLLFLLMTRSGFSIKNSIAASILWIMFPGSIYYGIVGQVEMAFLFFILLSAFCVSNGKISFKSIILSAFFFSMAVWIKETALGFIPVFAIFFLTKKEIKKGSYWVFLTILFCLPLLLQSVVPHEYDLFFELSNDLINWEQISFLKPFENILILIGFHSPDKLVTVLSAIMVFFVILASSIFSFIKFYDRFVVKFSVFSVLVFIPFFIFFPKKFDYYLLPVLLFSMILMLCFLQKNKTMMISVAFLFTVASINGLHWRTFIWNYYNETAELLKIVSTENPGAEIGTPTPHMAIYIKEKLELDVEIVALDFFSGYDPENCRLEDDRCILKSQYFLSTDEFTAVLFCSKWPLKKESCDMESMRDTLSKIKKTQKRSIFSLYKTVEH